MQDIFGSGGAYSDFFSQIFAAMGNRGAGSRSPAQPQRGLDVEQGIEITLEEAYRGAKRILQKDGQRLEIKIPAGAKTGTRVRLSGEGGPSSAGEPAGDLYLKVTVLPDPRFERKGDDLHTTVPVDLFTLVLGGEARVPTLEGELILAIPPETQNGRTFRLRGKGMPQLNRPESRGDLFARVEARLPVQLTARQKALFEELRQTSS
jgi:curved DNA-binding protein